jgi:hypothetical protein
MTPTRGVAALLNIGHAIDHMFLLIFATAVTTIATDFGLTRWEDLMPFGAGAFLLFGLGSLPAGRLGDLWGRRAMMVMFFFGMGASAPAGGDHPGAVDDGGGADLMGAFRPSTIRWASRCWCGLEPGADHRFQRTVRQPRHRDCCPGHRFSRQIRRLARSAALPAWCRWPPASPSRSRAKPTAGQADQQGVRCRVR